MSPALKALATRERSKHEQPTPKLCAALPAILSFSLFEIARFLVAENEMVIGLIVILFLTFLYFNRQK